MGKDSLLVLTKKDDQIPDIAMLASLPYVVGSEESAFVEAAKDATVIFSWSAPLELVRSVLAMAPKVRWVHSRMAGLDKVLFPELIHSDITVTNGRGVFSLSLKWRACGRILMSRRLQVKL
jgi:phosphoglycerate dehydrogenase-like enzyme